MVIVAPKKKRYTYKDYTKFPEGTSYRLRGELIMTPSPCIVDPEEKGIEIYTNEKLPIL